MKTGTFMVYRVLGVEVGNHSKVVMTGIHLQLLA